MHSTTPTHDWRASRRLVVLLALTLSLLGTLLALDPRAAVAQTGGLIGVDDSQLDIGASSFEANPSATITETTSSPAAAFRDLKVWFRLYGSSCERDIELRITNPSGETVTHAPYDTCTGSGSLLTTTVSTTDAGDGDWTVEFNDSAANTAGPAEFSVRAVRLDSAADPAGTVLTFTNPTGATDLFDQTLPAGVKVGYEPGETYRYRYSSSIVIESDFLHEDFADLDGDTSRNQTIDIAADVEITSLSRAGTDEWLNFAVPALDLDSTQEGHRPLATGDSSTFVPVSGEPEPATITNLPNVQILRDATGQVLEIRRPSGVAINELAIVEAIVADFHFTIDDSATDYTAVETNRGGERTHNYTRAAVSDIAAASNQAAKSGRSRNKSLTSTSIPSASGTRYTSTTSDGVSSSNTVRVLSDDGLLVSTHHNSDQDETVPLRTASIGGHDDEFTRDDAVQNKANGQTSIVLLEIVAAIPTTVAGWQADASAGTVAELSPAELEAQVVASERAAGHVETALAAIAALPTIDHAHTELTDAQYQAQADATLLTIRAMKWHPERLGDFEALVEGGASPTHARIVVGAFLARSDWSVDAQDSLARLLTSGAGYQRKQWIALGAVDIVYPQQSLVDAVGSLALAPNASPSTIRAWGAVASHTAKSVSTGIEAQLQSMTTSSDPVVAAAAQDALSNAQGPSTTTNALLKDLDLWEDGDNFGNARVGGTWATHGRIVGIDEEAGSVNVPAVDFGASASYHFFGPDKPLFNASLTSALDSTHTITDENANNWINGLGGPVDFGIVKQQFDFGLSVLGYSLIDDSFDIPCGIGSDKLGDLLLDDDGQPRISKYWEFDIPIWTFWNVFGIWVEGAVGVELRAPYGLGADFCRLGLQTARFDPQQNRQPTAPPQGGSYTDTNDHVAATYLVGVHAQITPTLNLNASLALRVNLFGWELTIGARGTLARFEVPIEGSANLLWVTENAWTDANPYTPRPTWAERGFHVQPCFNLDANVKLLQDVYIFVAFSLSNFIYDKIPPSIRQQFPWLEDATEPGGLEYEAGPYSVTADWANHSWDIVNSACAPFEPLTVTIIDNTTQDDYNLVTYEDPTYQNKPVGEPTFGTGPTAAHFCDWKGHDNITVSAEGTPQYQGAATYVTHDSSTSSGWKEETANFHFKYDGITCTGYGFGNASSNGDIRVTNLRVNGSAVSNDDQYPQNIPRDAASTYTFDIENTSDATTTVDRVDVTVRFNNGDIQEGTFAALQCTGNGVSLVNNQSAWEITSGSIARCGTLEFTPTADIDLGSMIVTIPGATSQLAWYSTTAGGTTTGALEVTNLRINGSAASTDQQNPQAIPRDTASTYTFQIRNTSSSASTVERTAIVARFNNGNIQEGTFDALQCTGSGVALANNGAAWQISAGATASCSTLEFTPTADITLGSLVIELPSTSSTAAWYSTTGGGTLGGLEIINLRINGSASSTNQQSPQVIPRDAASTYTFQIRNTSSSPSTARRTDLDARFSSTNIQEGTFAALQCSGSGVASVDNQASWEIEGGSTATCSTLEFTPTADIALSSLVIEGPGASSPVAWLRTASPAQQYPQLKLTGTAVAGQSPSPTPIVNRGEAFDVEFDIENPGEADLVVRRTEITKYHDNGSTGQLTCTPGAGVTTSGINSTWAISSGSKLPCTFSVTAPSTGTATSGSITVGADVDAGRGDLSRLTDSLNLGYRISQPTGTSFEVRVEVIDGPTGESGVVDSGDLLQITIDNQTPSDSGLTGGDLQLDGFDVELDYAVAVGEYDCGPGRALLVDEASIATAVVAAGGDLVCEIELQHRSVIADVGESYGAVEVTVSGESVTETATDSWGQRPVINIGQSAGGSGDGTIHFRGEGPVPYWVRVTGRDGGINVLSGDIVGQDDDWTASIYVDWNPETHILEDLALSAGESGDEDQPWDLTAFEIMYPHENDMILYPTVHVLEPEDILSVTTELVMISPQPLMFESETTVEINFELDEGDIVIGGTSADLPNGIRQHVTSAGSSFLIDDEIVDDEDIYRQVNYTHTEELDEQTWTHERSLDDGIEFEHPQNTVATGHIIQNGSTAKQIKIELVIDNWWQPVVVKNDQILRTDSSYTAELLLDLGQSFDSDLGNALFNDSWVIVPERRTTPLGVWEIPVPTPLGIPAIFTFDFGIENEWEFEFNGNVQGTMRWSETREARTRIRNGERFFDEPIVLASDESFDLDGTMETIRFKTVIDAEADFGLWPFDSLAEITLAAKLGIEGEGSYGEESEVIFYLVGGFYVGFELFEGVPLDRLGPLQGWTSPILDQDDYFFPGHFPRYEIGRWQWNNGDVSPKPPGEDTWTIDFDDLDNDNDGPEYRVRAARVEYTTDMVEAQPGNTGIDGGFSATNQIQAFDAPNTLGVASLTNVKMTVEATPTPGACAGDLVVGVQHPSGPSVVDYTPFQDCGTQNQPMTATIGLPDLAFTGDPAQLSSWTIELSSAAVGSPVPALIVDYVILEYDFVEAAHEVTGVDDREFDVDQDGFGANEQVFVGSLTDGQTAVQPIVDLYFRGLGTSCERDIRLRITDPSGFPREFEPFTTCNFVGQNFQTSIVLDDVYNPVEGILEIGSGGTSG